MKTENANSILETFEYFCQKSSKSICTILSYTVSKLVHFFEAQCMYHVCCLNGLNRFVDK